MSSVSPPAQQVASEHALAGSQPLKSRAGWIPAAHAFRAGLVDELHLFVAPIVLGGGKQSLPSDLRFELELLDERRFGSGMAYLHYRTRT